MNNEENTKEKSVEELANALTEGMGNEVTAEEEKVVEINIEDEVVTEETTDESPEEESVPEVPVAEESVEELPVEETPVEETPAEESTVVEAPVEETTVEEAPVEESATEEPKKKSKKGRIITLSIIGFLLVGITVAYLGISSYYKDKFVMGTNVNGVDCSEKTLAEVEAMLQKQVEEYALTIQLVNGANEVINGTDMGIKYGGYKQLKESFKEQNAYLWPKALFEATNIKAEIVFEYDQEKLNTLIAGLECVKPENQVAPVSAKVVYKDGTFVIRDEVYGTQLDLTKVNEAIHTKVSAMEQEVNLEECGCYVQPVYKKDSKEVLAAQTELNKYISASITYSLDNIEVVVDKDEIVAWVSVDANMTPVIDAAKVKAFTDTLGKKYNTANRGGIITTPTGKQANVAVAGYGRQVGSQEDCNQLISEIKEGKTVTRSPIISRQATPEGQFAWGTTYVEVDITEQHMWYVVNGQVAFETDVVTGKKGKNDTPTGTYTILEKMRNKVLRGRPLANGKPSYLTPVSYWMRVTWSGIGFHDAGWQPTFGGDRYVNNGSHGCINMPPAKAKEFYGMLSVGCPVVIHY